MYESIKQLISNNGVNTVFVDFYDTIVHRVTYPENVKKIWAKKLNFLHTDLYKLRQTIERDLCVKNERLKGSLDFHYDELCHELCKRISNSFSEVEMTKLFKETELEIEQDVQYLNTTIVNLLREFKSEHNLKIVLVSDFYMSKSMFIELLKFHEVYDIFDSIHISSEYGLTKSTGAIYHEVLQAEGLNASDVAMIGDNYRSDYLKAKENGLLAVHIDSSKQYKLYEAIESGRITKQKSFKELSTFVNYVDITFPQVALALYLFINLLHKRLKKDGFESVFFLSREGQFLKKIFECYTSSLDEDEAIKTNYMCVSRKSTFMPSLGELNDERFEMLFRQYVNLSVNDFLYNLNFSDDDVVELKKSFPDTDFDKVINDFPSSKVFINLKESIAFQRMYYINLEKQKESINAYADRIGFTAHNLAIVDVGWKGTIQDNLRKTFNCKKLTGYYLGLTERVFISEKNSKYGILFEPEKGFNNNYTECVFNECRALFEILLGADHGSTLGYSVKGEPVFDHNESELSFFNENINAQQNEIADHFSLLVKFFKYLNLNDDQMYEMIAYEYAHFAFSPNSAQVDFIARAKHFENFGMIHYSEFGRNSKTGVMNYIVNLVSFLLYPRRYLRNSWWKSYKLKLNGLDLLSRLYKLYRMSKLSR